MIDFLTILDASLQPKYILDSFQSVIWHSRFFGIGDFEIYCQATPQNVQNITKDAFVVRSDVANNREVGIIRSVRLTNDPQNGVMMIASGYFAKSILSQRLLYLIDKGYHTLLPLVYSGKVEDVAFQAVSDAIIAPFYYDEGIRYDDPNDGRIISIIQEGGRKGYTETIDSPRQAQGENLFDWLTALLSEYSISCDLKPVIVNGAVSYLAFTVQKGEDRTGSILISGTLDNLINSTYDSSTQGEKTSALLRGDTRYASAVFAIVGDEKSGLDRKETFVNAGSIKQYMELSELQALYPGGEVVPDSESPEYYEIGSERIASYSDNLWGLLPEYYIPLINPIGSDALQKASKTVSYKGEIDVSSGTYQLGTDYFLGDYVSLYDDKIGVKVTVQVTETTEVVDDTGSLVSAVFETKTLPSS